jgi:nucleoside-diphosphate-sugar epimerase
MHVFVIGATGYIGGTVALRLLAAGHRVSGLARSQGKAAALKAIGIEPVAGTLSDLTALAEAARVADAVVNAANADDYEVARTLVQALAGSGKPLLHTSGTSVIADRALGEPGGIVYTEDMPPDPLPERLLRVALDTMLLRATGEGVRSVVIRPSLIYGRGPGLNPHSVQIPRLIGLARERGRPAHVGRGLNVWSHVHIDDVAEAYLRALTDAPPGSVFYLENGEAPWREMAIAAAAAVGIGGEPEALSAEESLRLFGVAAITTFGSNSRVSAQKARRVLGWTPTGPSLWEDLRSDYYPTAFGGSGSQDQKRS